MPNIPKSRKVKVEKSNIFTLLYLPNGLRYPLGVGGGLAIETEKTQSSKNAQKTRRVPQVGCTLCY
jgi:hypothetical protein